MPELPKACFNKRASKTHPPKNVHLARLDRTIPSNADHPSNPTFFRSTAFFVLQPAICLMQRSAPEGLLVHVSDNSRAISHTRPVVCMKSWNNTWHDITTGKPPIKVTWGIASNTFETRLQDAVEFALEKIRKLARYLGRNASCKKIKPHTYIYVAQNSM